ncbi:MAG: AAA family ATPase [Chloroflexales bacterium]|nr:AAA family ATPase [Chloroflexales bacterium]
MAYEVSFGEWMVNRRRELRLQRTELAIQVGCAAVTLRKIEADERRPSQQLAALLAERLGIAPHERTTFVRVARGELTADHLPALSLTQAGTAPGPHAPTADVQPERTGTPVRTNLPAPLTSFVGRSQELDVILALIENQRLVTLTGVGGVGKTRLATEVGIHIVRHGQPPIARDGVWIVELASLAEPALVAQAIARIFRLPEQSGRTMVELLQEHLAEQQLLLILDNCEHLVEICAEIAEQLVLHCWQLHILATSREPLRVPGERAYPIPPLTLPEPNELQSAQILTSPAAQLFVARMDAAAGVRASTAAPADRIDSTNAAAIAQICRQLDGIPLALELAAPLSQSTALTEIAAQLQNQMAILTNTYRTAVPRHQTMHSALVWSYRLLAPEEQRLLASVAVFAGGWTIAAAQAIYAEVGVERLLPGLDQLVAKSLALQEEHGGQRRYRLLEPVRQFAHAQLVASGMEDAVRRRHAAYFLALAEQMDQARDTPQERVWLDLLEPERDNLRAVNIWAIEHGEAELAHRFNGWLFAFWIYRSSVAEASHWYDLALAIPIANNGHTPAISALVAEANMLNAAGFTVVVRLFYERARARFERELALRIEIGLPRGIAGALRGCSFVAMLSGDLEQAQKLGEQGLATSHSAEDHWGIAWSLYDLGYIALVRGDAATAQPLLEAALPQLRAHGISFGLYRALIALGHVMRITGETGRARGFYHEALRLQQHLLYLHYVADALEGLAGIAAAEQALTHAVTIFGAAEAHRRAIAMPRWPHQQPWLDRDVALARSQLAPQQWDLAWERGYTTPLDQAIVYALLPPSRP